MKGFACSEEFGVSVLDFSTVLQFHSFNNLCSSKSKTLNDVLGFKIRKGLLYLSSLTFFISHTIQFHIPVTDSNLIACA